MLLLETLIGLLLIDFFDEVLGGLRLRLLRDRDLTGLSLTLL
jgi:hypothetical protein